MGENNAFSNIKNFLKGAFKVVKTFFVWIGGALASLMPMIIIIIAIVLIIMVVVGSIAYAFSGGYDANSGLISSVGGVKGDQFYGTRFIYYDEEYTALDLQDEYLEFTYNILEDVQNSITITLNGNYKEDTQVKTFATNFANKLAQSSGKTLLECTTIIQHYGFDESETNAEGKTEKQVVLESLSSSLSSHLKSGVGSIYTELENAYDLNFGYMKNVCAKILIKDYILDADKTTSNIPKKNYLGFVYMPKQDVIINTARFIYAVDQDKTVSISANYKNETLIEEIATDTADSTWFSGSVSNKYFECKFDKYILNEFTAIETNNQGYLSEGKTIFDIYKDGKGDVYFNNPQNVSSNVNLLESFKTNNYIYLQMQADSQYNMAESITDYQ